MKSFFLKKKASGQGTFFSPVHLIVQLTSPTCCTHTEYYLGKVKFILGKSEERKMCLNCRT